MLAVVLVEIEMVEHANQDLGVGEIFGEGFVGNVVEGFAASVADGGEVFGLESRNGAVLEVDVIGDAVDGKAGGDGLGKLLLRGFLFAYLLIEVSALGGHHLIELFLRVGKTGDCLKNLLAGELGVRVVGGIGKFVVHDGGNVVAAKLFLNFGAAIPFAEGAKAFVGHLFGEEVGGGFADEGLRIFEQVGQRFAGLLGVHGAVEEKCGGIGIEIKGMFGDVDDAVGIEKKFVREGTNVDAGLAQF